MSKTSQMTSRRAALADLMGRAGTEPWVAQVQYINRHGNIVGNEKAYHYNLPAHIPPMNLGEYALVRNSSGRFTVVKVIAVLSPGAYRGAVEWIVARVDGRELQGYITAEGRAKQAAEEAAKRAEQAQAAREKLEGKKAQLTDAEAEFRNATNVQREALARLGRWVLADRSPLDSYLQALHRTAERALRVTEGRAKVCDDLAREIRELEAQL